MVCERIMMVLGMRGRGRPRGQIALEFIVVYSVVLIVFLLVFAIISGQRAASLNAQQASIARIEAQEIASYMDRAVSAGSGYYSSVSLAQGLGSVPYNIYITTSGVVIVNSTAGGQPVSAFAFSDARNASIGGILQYSGNGIGIYHIPSYTGVIGISNMGGTVYIDKNPVSNAGLPGSGILTNVQENYVANFNTSVADSEVIIASDNALNLSSSPPNYTILIWFREANVIFTEPEQEMNLVSKVSVDTGSGYKLELNGGGCNGLIDFDEEGIGAGHCMSPTPQDTAWHQLGLIANSVGLFMYTDGALTHYAPVTTPIKPGSWSPFFIIGSQKQPGTSQTNYYFTGQLSNLQIYNGSITPRQINASYAAGPLGGPVAQTNRLLGWWPLNGNANDYSGNGQNGLPLNVTYQTLAWLNLSISARNGTALSNVPVGVVISSGLAGGLPFSTNNRSTNGHFSSIVTYNTVNPNVTVYTFDGNLTTANSLVGWWPLSFGDLGGGNTLYDIAGNDNAVAAANTVAWKPLAVGSQFAGALFPGNTVTLNASTESLQNITAANSLTLVAWVDYNGGAGGACAGIFGSGGMAGNGIQLTANNVGGNCRALYIGGNGLATNPLTLSRFNWTMLTATWNGKTGMAAVFENGTAMASSQLLPGGNSITPFNSLYYIGAETGAGGNPFNGLISNVQMYSQPLGAAQIAQLYAQGPTGLPLAGSGLSGWWPLAGNSTDYSGGNSTLANNALFGPTNYTFGYGTPPTSRMATFNGMAEMKIAGGPATPFAAAGPFSTSLWFTSYNSPSTAFDYYLLDADVPVGGYDVQLCGACVGGRAGLHGDVGTGSSGLSSSVNYAFNFVPMRLYNLVETFSTSGWTMYLNGVNVSNGVYAGTPKIAGAGGTSNMYMGGGTSATSNFIGQIADVQVYNTVLTPAQARQIYQQGISPQSGVTLSMG